MSKSEKHASLSYADAGVDIDAGNALVERIKPAIQKTKRPGALGSIGGFGGLFDLNALGYDDPILVAGTDGVGTKLLLARELGKHDTIGIDLVAMVVNDLVVQGAEPLFFLDYFATSKLNVDEASTVIQGIAEGCKEAGCALIGGETAEMPDLYKPEDYDLAGFAIGAVERTAILPKSTIQPGNVVIGLASSGVHSNGYSLVRRILKDSNADLEEILPNTQKTLGETLLEPTKIYVKPCLDLIHNIEVKALAHITGGGLTENIPRVLQEDLGVEIDASSWQVPEIFSWLQSQGNIEPREMLRTFNCGIGMVVIADASLADDICSSLASHDISASVIGYIARKQKESVIYTNLEQLFDA